MARAMDRREFLKRGGAAAAGLFAGRPFRSGRPRPGRRPNVLMFAVDDLRPELGCYGVEGIKTPNIDALASRGVAFSRAYCQQSICNPARACLLTGLRPDTLGVGDNDIPFRRRAPNLVTLPQLFKGAGYHCVEVGKIFHGTLPDPRSWSRPDPEIPVREAYMDAATRARQEGREATARRQGRPEGWISAYLRGPATEAFDAPDNAYWDGAVADAAIGLLSQLKDEAPFFLGVGFTKPHLPFIAPKRYWDLYKREGIPPAANPFLPHGAPAFAMNGLSELAAHEDFVQVPNPAEGRLDEAQARLLKHGYWACVSFMDAQVGRVLTALDRFGLGEDTIVVFWGDQGWKLGEHGGWGKQTNYEVDTRVPLIVSAPGRGKAGAASPALVEFADVYPTLSELAGLTPPPGLEGTSFVPLLGEPGRPWKSAAFSQYARGFTYRFMGRAMRTDRYRYIEWRDVIDGTLVATELYDHASDPQENENVAGGPERRDLVRDLGAQLAAGWAGARPR